MDNHKIVVITIGEIKEQLEEIKYLLDRLIDDTHISGAEDGIVGSIREYVSSSLEHIEGVFPYCKHFSDDGDDICGYL